jgi:hypothetical protein
MATRTQQTKVRVGDGVEIYTGRECSAGVQAAPVPGFNNGDMYAANKGVCGVKDGNAVVWGLRRAASSHEMVAV